MTAFNRDLAARIAETGVPLSADMAPRRDACKGCGSQPADWCPDCAACEDGCFGGHENNSCSHSNAPWGGQ